MTREQIGAALGYANPQKAVGNLHNAHKERMDRYSFLESRNGRNIYFYNRKGIMELCRWSQQAKADAFMDFCWEVIDSLMRGEAKLVLLQDYPSALRALADSEERRLALESANVNLSPEMILSPAWLYRELHWVRQPIQISSVTHDFTCPSCGAPIARDFQNFCGNCAQALDWSCVLRTTTADTTEEV